MIVNLKERNIAGPCILVTFIRMSFCNYTGSKTPKLEQVCFAMHLAVIKPIRSGCVQGRQNSAGGDSAGGGLRGGGDSAGGGGWGEVIHSSNRGKVYLVGQIIAILQAKFER